MSARQKALTLAEFAIDRVSDAVIWTDRDARVVYANEAACRFLGYSREELLSMRIPDFDPDFGVERWPDHWRELKARKALFFESRHRTRDGRIHPVEISAHYLEFAGTEYNIGFARDITERKRTETALRQAVDESRQHQTVVTALLAGSRAVLKHGQFMDAAQSIFNACKNLTGATSGYVALLSKDGTENEVLFLDSGGLPCSVDPTLPMPIRGMREITFRTGKAVCENDFPQSAWVQFMPGGHVALENVLFAPLVIAEKTVGLLGLANKPGGFTENDTRITSALGEFAAIALRNSQLLGELEAQRAVIREVSTPVLPFGKGLLIVPLIGSIDAARARQLTEELLRAIRANRAKVVVIDVTGVASIDTAVANHLVQTANASRLLGAKVILTGISRAIAQTLVTLRVDLRELTTMGDLQRGVEEGHRLLGCEVVPWRSERGTHSGNPRQQAGRV